MKDTPGPPRILRTTKEILIPDGVQVATSLFAATMVYAVASAEYYWALLTGGEIALKDYSSDLLNSAYSQLSHLPGASSATVSFLWGVAGIAIYLSVLLCVNFFINVRNNAAYNVPYHNKPKLMALALLAEYRRLIWVVLLGIALWITAMLLPVWFGYFDEFTRNHAAVIPLLLGLLGLAYNLYIVSALTAAVFRNPKVTTW